jgi:predicted transcriptional regulator
MIALSSPTLSAVFTRFNTTRTPIVALYAARIDPRHGSQ